MTMREAYQRAVARHVAAALKRCANDPFECAAIIAHGHALDECFSESLCDKALDRLIAHIVEGEKALRK